MKLWDGRFKRGGGTAAQQFTASIGFDGRLYREDIAGSQAHVRMLAHQGIISPAEAQCILVGLQEIRGEIERGELAWSLADEDIHLNVERRLLAKLGPVAGKLHTARSRNDQVALDTRLFLRQRLDELVSSIWNLQWVLMDQAEQHLDTLMPGYTHLQVAQPVSLAHHLLAYCEMLERDQARLTDCRRRTDVSPLGACALAGTSFPIDPAMVARELGFSSVFANSMDAVSDRDFIVEFLSAASLIMIHLSRLAEELVLWSTHEFAFVSLEEAWAGGSSIMPQKKNPDSMELLRGKTARVVGHLVAMLMVLKGLPLAYNSDLQEDKEALFDACDTLEQCLCVATQVVGGLTFHTERMAQAAREGHATATELADLLARRGLPFREAHALVGTLVARAEERGIPLHQWSLVELQQVSPQLDEAAQRVLDAADALRSKTSPGGTAPERVKEALRQGRARAAERMSRSGA